MRRTQAEELLLLVLGIAMLSYLLPFSLARDVIASLAIAIVLIILLFMMSLSWHLGDDTPFDPILIIGIIISLAYLITFYAFMHSTLNNIILLLFTSYYLIMAAILYWYRATISSIHIVNYPLHEVTHAQQETRHTTHRAPRQHQQLNDLTHDPAFRAGIEPIPERDPPPVHPRSALRRLFRKGMRTIPEQEPPHSTTTHNTKQEHKPHVDPLPDMHTPETGKLHNNRFMQGIEPIHHLEVYDLDNEKTEPTKIKKRPRKN